jgi:acyl-CoA synthetase (AMP-forming)/AMP-acid ligase II
MNIGDIARRNAKRYPDKTALIFENQRFTFTEFNQRVNMLANALSHLGMNQGDRIAVLSEGCNQCVETCCATAKTGMVMAPINPHLSPRDICYLINNAQALTVMVANEYKEVIHSLHPELVSVKNFIVIGPPWKEMSGYEELIRAHSSEEPEERVVADEELFYFPITGGTTGRPKQMMHTHRTINADMLNVFLALGITHEDTGLSANPPYWGKILLWLAQPLFYMGSTMVVTKGLDPESVLRAIEVERITTSILPSSFIAYLLTYPELDKYDLSSLRVVGLTGMPLPEEVMRKATTRMGKVFGMMYGLTELGLITYLAPQEMACEGLTEKLRRLRSCGREAAPLNVDVRVVDDDRCDIAPGQVGEIIAKGDHLMKGYLNMPRATEEAIKGGWLYTEDLATIDEEGYLYVLDRKKDAILSGGNIIPSSEVEGIIYSHPSVLEVAVIGVPDEELGEAVKAIVVPKEGEKITQEEIIELCRNNLPAHATPKSVDFVSELPKSAMGKVMKGALRQRYERDK